MQENDRPVAAITHLAAFAGYLTGGLGFILGPLIVWLLKKNDSPFVDYHGRSCMNFQLSFFLYSLGLGILGLFVILFMIVVGEPLIFFISVVFLVIVGLGLALAQIVFTIVAAIRASDGQYYRYPLTIPFLTLPQVPSYYTPGDPGSADFHSSNHPQP